MPRIVDVDVTRHTVGDIVYAGNNTLGLIPNSLACDGSTVLQATYPALYAKIGATYNIGVVAGGSFMLPDMRSRSPMAAGSGPGLTTRAIGALPSSEETHALTEAEMPTHAHAGGTTDVAGSHHHNYQTSYVDGSQTLGPIGDGLDVSLSSHNATTSTVPGTINHTHSIATVSGAGGGVAHNNIAPVLVSQFVIVYA